MKKPNLTAAALDNLAECGLDDHDVAVDVQSVRDGTLTADKLLKVCLDGADGDRAQGWREYVAAVVAAA
jgi:hypothetical protein